MTTPENPPNSPPLAARARSATACADPVLLEDLGKRLDLVWVSDGDRPDPLEALAELAVSLLLARGHRGKVRHATPHNPENAHERDESAA